MNQEKDREEVSGETSVALIDAAVDETMFYVMDARTTVGNCILWWCPDGKGYTCNLDRAGLYSKSSVEGMRETDVPVGKELAESLAIRHVRIEHVRQASADVRGLLARAKRPWRESK